jgi:hypothetical protein
MRISCFAAIIADLDELRKVAAAPAFAAQLCAIDFGVDASYDDGTLV